jgi:hypothetical protein
MSKIAVPIVAILSIVLIEVTAISNGIDGALMSASFVAIGGVCGYWIKSIKKR